MIFKIIKTPITWTGLRPSTTPITTAIGKHMARSLAKTFAAGRQVMQSSKGRLSMSAQLENSAQHMPTIESTMLLTSSLYQMGNGPAPSPA